LVDLSDSIFIIAQALLSMVLFYYIALSIITLILWQNMLHKQEKLLALKNI